MAGRVIIVKDIPSAANKLFTNSSFFKKISGELPSPEQVRQKSIETDGNRARSPRPPPVAFEEQGLCLQLTLLRKPTTQEIAEL